MGASEMGASAKTCVVCVNCGTDPRSGARASTMVARAPRSTGSSPDAGWRVPIGVIAIVVGALGIVNYAIPFVVGLLTLAAQPLTSLIVMVVSVLVALIPLYHLLGGVGLLRRTTGSVERLRRTSALFVGVVIAAFALVALLSIAASGASGTDPDELAYGLGFLCGAIGVSFVWPIFVYVFLGRASIAKATQAW